MGARIKRDVGADIEHHTFKRGRQCFHCILQTETIAVDSMRKNQMQAIRAIFKIIKRLLVGGLGVGMINPRHDAPSLSRRPPNHRLCALGFAVKRVDADRVGGRMNKFFIEIGPFEHGFDPIQPVMLACLRHDRQEDVIGHQASPINDYRRHNARR